MGDYFRDTKPELDIVKGVGFTPGSHDLVSLADVLTAMKGVGFTPGTHDLKALADVLTAMKGAGFTPGTHDLKALADIITALQGVGFVTGTHSNVALKNTIDSKIIRNGLTFTGWNLQTSSYVDVLNITGVRGRIHMISWYMSNIGTANLRVTIDGKVSNELAFNAGDTQHFVGLSRGTSTNMVLVSSQDYKTMDIPFNTSFRVEYKYNVSYYGTGQIVYETL